MSHKDLAEEFKIQVLAMVQSECKTLCNPCGDFMLWRSSPEDLKVFLFSSLESDLLRLSPFLLSVFSTISNNCRPVTCAAISIALRGRAPRMSAFAHYLNNVLHYGGAKKAVYSRLSKLGITTTHNNSIVKQKEMADTYADGLLVLKRQNEAFLAELNSTVSPGEENLDTVLSDVFGSMEQLQLSETAEEAGPSHAEGPVLDQDVRISSQPFPEQQSTPPHTYSIVLDNLDFFMHAHHQSSRHSNQSIHWIHHIAVQDRIPIYHLPIDKPCVDLLQYDLRESLPGPDTQLFMRREVIVLGSQILTQYLAAFRPFSRVVLRHIPHQYSEEMSQPSTDYPLGLIFKNENKTSDLSEALRHIQQKYVPNCPDGVSSVLVGGDGLTEANCRNIQWSFAEGPDEKDMMGNMVFMFEDWHAIRVLFEIHFKLFFNVTSGKDHGTLCANMTKLRSSRPQHTTFHKDLVLLQSPTWETVVKHVTKRRLHEAGHVINAFEIQKSWTAADLIREVRSALVEKIPADVSIELLMPCGNKLVPPSLQHGTELSGFMVHRVCRSKTIYIRPSRSLQVNIDSDGSSTEDSNRCERTRRTRARVTDGNATTEEEPLSESDSVVVLNDDTTTLLRSDPVLPRPDPVLPRPDPVLPRPDPPNHAPHDDSYGAYLAILPSSATTPSDDEDLQQGILASLESQKLLEQKNTKSAQEVLLDLQSQIDNTKSCRFNLNRSCVLDGALRGFKRLSYSPQYQMTIKFSDDMGVNEEAVDLGGPRREFLRLLMEALANSSMFEGRNGKLNLALDSLALREDHYFIAGRAIAVSLVHGGPPPGFISGTLYSLLVEPGEVSPVLEDIADSDLHEKLKKVSRCASLTDLLTAIEPMQDYLANAGCLRQLKSIEERDVFVQDILMFQVVHRVHRAFERFKEGMKTLGVLDALRMHPDNFRHLMCYEPAILSAELLENLFEVRKSGEGTNKRLLEERVVPLWNDYLLNSEEVGPSKLGEILTFATGADKIPPVGFSPKPSIEFLHEMPDSLFPMANTCINCLKLPLIFVYEKFEANMDFALANTHGFGQE
ncbi:uncharacterized protein LOC134092781 isoform X2 [Sardina pilchardus]|uniref:uncharacterized protein LOC134092781 isoform X2 n=1 Tax=Sardina pilchardus TaxID=27697 RepID=UPI002E12141D